MALRFNVPPNWPQAPSGWIPPDGWQPDPAWGAPPPGWQFWIDDAVGANARVATPETISVDPPAADGPAEVPLFGARDRARQYAAQAQQLRHDGELLRAERDRLSEELSALRSEMDRLGVLPIYELEKQKRALGQAIVEQQAELEQRRLQQRAALDHDARLATEALRRDHERLTSELVALGHQLAQTRQEIVVTAEIALLQEAGVYQYRHPLSDAVAYQAQIARIQDQIKAMVRKDGGAVTAQVGWTVNGSTAEGRVMVRDFSKLMLRAYNAEADNLARGMKPYKLDSSMERLNKVATTIAKLGKTMSIHITPEYHYLRIQELQLTADYLEKVAEEKVREREEKARLREERLAQQEIEREKARLEKERQHHANALAAAVAKGDEVMAARLREQLDEVDHAIKDVDFRAANVRAGYVYVISNIGAFGENMVKIGMTRRLDPLDRIRELSDASVPFNFDVHALYFSKDAVGIESQMHSRVAQRRVNLVNQRREFFYITPQDAKLHLLDLAGDLLQYEEVPEALEYRQSRERAGVSTA